jgi:hypothetical protein
MTTIDRTTRECPACSAEMGPSDRFCRRCGHNAGPVPVDPGASGVRWTARV